MEVVYVAGAALVLLMFAAMIFALSSENKTKSRQLKAKADLERAKTERTIAFNFLMDKMKTIKAHPVYRGNGLRSKML